jgi:hypothetical protein
MFWVDIVAGMPGNGHSPRLRRMFELAMASNRGDQIPAIGVQQFEQVAYFHTEWQRQFQVTEVRLPARHRWKHRHRIPILQSLVLPRVLFVHGKQRAPFKACQYRIKLFEVCPGSGDGGRGRDCASQLFLPSGFAAGAEEQHFDLDFVCVHRSVCQERSLLSEGFNHSRTSLISARECWRRHKA